MYDAPVLIIGGNGKTGRRVDLLLKEQGIATRPVSRSTPIPFDWSRPDGWGAVMEGARKAYVTFQPDLAVAGSTEAIAEFSRQALGKGIEHIVLLSGRGEPGAQRAEAALRTSGIGWTTVRASWFNQNFSEGYLIDGVLAGEVALPAQPVAEPFVDADDIAAVVFAALTDSRHLNRLYEVTGPRSLNFAEAVAEISAATARHIDYRRISPDEFAERLHPVAEREIIGLLNELFTVVLDGRNTCIADGVERALGRPAKDFADYARETAASGVWDKLEQD